MSNELQRLSDLEGGEYDNVKTAVEDHLSSVTELASLRMREAERRIQTAKNERTPTLDLSGLLLSEPPDSLWQLTELEWLELDSNNLRILPDALGSLTKLKTLYLHSNKLSALPSTIENLKDLEFLSLLDNNLEAIPSGLRRLEKLESLLLHGNHLLGLPDDVLGPRWLASSGPRRASPPKEILDYYFAHQEAAQEGGTAPLMEAKVLVLGEASVGKSCLIAAISEGKKRHEVSEAGTSGIVRKLWEVRVAGNTLAEKKARRGTEKLRLNCWDFGGQEIYHSAHTFFLTKRAIYLIVVSKRDNDRQNNVDYWLRMAVSFGGSDAVIYVIVNKSDEKVGFPPDEEALRRRYPQLRGFLYTSCDDLVGIDEARRLIVEEALRLDGVRLPVAKTWLSFKKLVEKMTDHTLSLEQWTKMCEKRRIRQDVAQKELLHLCDRLGTVRYFPTKDSDPPALRNTAILNPEWITLGIYALLDDEGLKKAGGLLTRNDMIRILRARKYPATQAEIVEELMRRFDLLYDSIDHGDNHKMLVPLMLPEREPALNWPRELALEFVYEYEVVPAGLLPAFIARMHWHLAKDSTTWRHGCVLEIKGCRVRVIGDSETKRVLISVLGSEASRREALDLVRFTFESLHDTIQNLQVQQLIPVPGHADCPMMDYDFVRSLDWQGKSSFETKSGGFGKTITVYVRQALDGVRGSERRQVDEKEGKAVNLTLNLHNENNPIMSNKNEGANHGIIARDIIGSQVGLTLTNCSNQIEQGQNAEVKMLLQQVYSEVSLLVKRLPEEKGEVAVENLDLLIRGITKKNRPWYDVSADGLIEASKFVKDFSGNIAGTLKNLGRLVWPDAE